MTIRNDILKTDFIIRYDETGNIDHSRSRELILDTSFDDRELNLEKLTEVIQSNPNGMFWLQETLKYAMRVQNSVRNNGSSDVIMFQSQEWFDDIWQKKGSKK